MIEENEKKENKSTYKDKRGRVILRNLPFTVKEEKLKELFGDKYGEISEINIVKDKQTGKIKGYAFIQFQGRKEAMNAITDLNNTDFEKRKITLELSVPKDQYENELKEKQEKAKKEEKEKSVEKTNTLKFFENQTLFIKNLNFNTDEESLKTFFEAYGKVKSAKIVKNKETGTSKGSGFVLMQTSEQCDKILSIYEKYSSNPENLLNPFELDGRTIEIYNAVSRQNADKLVEERKNRELNTDKRNFKNIFYGLNPSDKFKNPEISSEDLEKRDLLVKIKKDEFNANPNLHISKTRVTVRNLIRAAKEEDIKELIKEAVDSYISTLDEEKKSYYNKVRKIKQVKVLFNEKELNKDGEPKSKCIAFVELCDNDVAKYTIDYLNNHKIGNKNLILEFSLEDSRKTLKREKNVIERKKKIREAKSAEKKKEKEEKKEKPKEETIEGVEDTSKLMEIYHSTLSRGKKQRIKKKLKKFGINPDLMTKNNNPNFAKKKIPDTEFEQSRPNNKYIAKKINLNNGKDINVKNQKKVKNQGNEEMLNKKRKRGGDKDQKKTKDKFDRLFQ